MSTSSASFGFLTLAIFMAIVKLNTARNITFFPEKLEIRKDVDSCEKVEFVVKNVTEDLWCMLKCAKNETCKGVFSDPTTGHCVGCSQAVPSLGAGNTTNGTYFELRSKRVVKSCEGPEWVKFQGYCYLFTERYGFQAALNDCIRRGADIAVIENEDENAFLREQAIAGGDKFYVTGVMSDPRVLNGTWVRYNTTIPATYLPWNEGEPNNGIHLPRCATLHHNRDYQWADEHCQIMSKTVHMICKMQA